MAPTTNQDWHDPSRLVQAVIGDLNHSGQKVAVGLEGPLWIPRPSASGTALRERFRAERRHLWYVPTGDSVAMMAIGILADLLVSVAAKAMTVTDDHSRWQQSSGGCLLVYESFLPTNAKPVPPPPSNVRNHEWDAFVTAALLFEFGRTGTYLQSCPPPTRTRGTSPKLMSYAPAPVPTLSYTLLWPLAAGGIANLGVALGVAPPLTLGWA